MPPARARMNRGLFRAVSFPAVSGTGEVNRVTVSAMPLKMPVMLPSAYSYAWGVRIRPQLAQFSFSAICARRSWVSCLSMST